ncbi:unnamed protein product [Symbiodinium sp. CCMP2592]|nr:unnamed protein product [Symbiodinium sp. CCMP2592]
MTIERKRAVKQLVKSLPQGPIAVDSDDEPNPSPPVKPAALPATSAANPDAVETQAFEVNTQLLQDALSVLDQPVPSPPAKTFAEERTLVLSPQDTKSPVAVPAPPAETETPSPRGVVVADITPVKSYPSRDDQLRVKSTNEEVKKAEKEAKAAAKAAAKQGARGRGGRGRGRGGRGMRKSTPDEGANDDQSEAEAGDEDGEASEPAEPKKKGGRPKKHQPESSETEPKKKGGPPKKDQPESSETEPKKKGGRCKKDQPECSETKPKKKGGRPKKDLQECPETETAEHKSKRAKTAHAAAADADAPGCRVRGKRSADQALQPKPKRAPAQTLSGFVWPNTFARRYRPQSESYTQKLWRDVFLHSGISCPTFLGASNRRLRPGSVG